MIGSADCTVDGRIHRDGNCSLRVKLGTEQYSGIALEYFPRNWKGAKAFRFSVFNPSNQGLSLTCRIHDQQHESGCQRYSDRFNHRYKLPSGWTTIEIDAGDILDALKGRQMDMGHIVGVVIFAVSLPRSRVIYIDGERLVF